MVINEKIRILHTGDIQIEVRNNNQRYDEFEFLFQQIEMELENKKPNVYLIAGDVFEYYNANDNERNIFINHILRVLKFDYLKEIVIQDGNHDINQRKDSNFFEKAGEKTTTLNSLQTICDSFNNDKILYVNDSLIYISKNIENLAYFNWSQKIKHSNISQHNYNPVLNYDKSEIDLILKTYTCVTLYHDPINVAINFDNKLIKGVGEIEELSKLFITNTVLAGDIHMPQIHEYKLENGNIGKFIYCSSPIQRNFGEGDYYEDGFLYQKGVNNHKLNYVELNKSGQCILQQYIDMKQYNSFNTFKLSINANLENLNWKVINCGTNLTTIRLSFPSASEKYLNVEQDIINNIKEENKNIVLKFVQSVYGKNVIDDLNENQSSLNDINELLNIDKIINISKEYIEDIVNKTKTISIDDKTKCIEYIQDLFINELQNYNQKIVSNKINLISCSASNFMSFGQNVNVDLNHEGITKLTGGNGVGKTTLYNFISFMLTSLISINQNKNHKTNNLLLVFNDYQYELDEVTGCLNFVCNNEMIKIRRKVTRTWKRNTTLQNKKSKQWRDFISNVSEELEVQTLNNVLNNDVAQDYLDSIFKGIDNLHKIVFVNDATLQKMIKTDSATLCEEILHNIGFNFFDLMMQRYDSLREEKMQNLTKSKVSVEVMQQEIIENESKIIETNKIDLHLKNQLKNENDSLTKLHNQKSELIEQKYKTTNEEIIKLKNDYDSKLNIHNNDINNLNDSINKLKSKIKIQRTIDVVKNDLKNENENLSNLKQNELNHKNEIKIHSMNFDNNKTSIENRKNVIKQKLQNEILSLKNDNQNNIIENNKLKSDITSLLNDFKAFISNEKSNLNQQLNDLKMIKNTYSYEQLSIVEKINNISSTIETIKKSPETCDKCHSKLSDELLNKRVETVKKLHEDLESENSKLSSIIEKIKSIDEQIIILQNKIKNIDSNIFDEIPIIITKYNLIKTEIETIKNKITNIDNEINIIDNKIIVINQNLEKQINEDEEIKTLESKNQIIPTTISTIQKSIDDNTILMLQATNDIKKLEFEIIDIENNDKILLQFENDLKIKEIEGKNFPLILESIKLKEIEVQKNIEIQIKIDDIDIKLTNQKLSIENISNEINVNTININNFKKIIEDLKIDINNTIEYRIVESSFKQYKTLIGKKGLLLYIFSLIKPILNSKLNDLLIDMDFRLQFDEDNNLQMLDLSKPNNPVRSMFAISGMQTVFCGLSLLYINKNNNLQFMMKDLYIDEISGKLNDGKNLNYKSLNYQIQLKRLLRKFENMKIMIIDHVIDNMEEDRNLQVIPSNEGADIIEIQI